MRPCFVRLLLAVFAVTTGTGAGCPPQEPPTFTHLQEQIFQPRCSFAACHGGSGAVAGLDLASNAYGTLVNVASSEDPTVLRVKPGDPDNSLLYQVLVGEVGNTRQMPPGATLPAEEIELVRLWVEAGAEDN